MNPVVTISGGGIIGNYISSRLNNNNIETLVIEKSPADLSDKENIRTLTLNSYSKELLDDLGMILTTLNAFPSCVVSLISNPSNSVCNARKRISYVMCELHMPTTRKERRNIAVPPCCLENVLDVALSTANFWSRR